MPGTRFNKSALIGSITGNYERREIALSDKMDEAEHWSYDDDLAKWRKEQVARVYSLSGRLSNPESAVSDIELQDFRITSPPSKNTGKYTKDEAERELLRLRIEREKVLGYVKALAEVEPGIVELAAADMRRIGYSA